MAYNYTNGDGLSVLLPGEPLGTAEPVGILDDAIRQIKAFLLDPEAGGANWLARLSAVEANVGVNNGFFHAVTQADFDVVAGAGAGKILFTAELADGLNQYAPANSRFSALATGKYLFKLGARFQIVTSSAPQAITHLVQLVKNGTDVVATATIGKESEVDGGMIMIDRVVDLSVGDTVEAFYNITVFSGTITGRLLFDVTQTYWQGWRIQ